MRLSQPSVSMWEAVREGACHLDACHTIRAVGSVPSVQVVGYWLTGDLQTISTHFPTPKIHFCQERIRKLKWAQCVADVVTPCWGGASALWTSWWCCWAWCSPRPGSPCWSRSTCTSPPPGTSSPSCPGRCWPPVFSLSPPPSWPAAAPWSPASASSPRSSWAWSASWWGSSPWVSWSTAR